MFVKFALCPDSLRDSARIFCQYQSIKGASELKTWLIRAAERKLLLAMSQKAYRRAVVRRRLRLWFLELPESLPDQDSGSSETSDSEDSYKLGAEYFDSIEHGEQKLSSQRTREARRATSRAHCSKANAFLAQAGVSKTCRRRQRRDC